MRDLLKGKFATKPAYTLERKVNLLRWTNWLSRYPFKVEITGSNPVRSTIGR